MKKPLLCIYKIITAIFFISIIVTPSISEGADILKMLIWEGYFPHKQVEKFEALIKKKYGKEVRLEISHNVSDIQNFYDGIRSKSYHIISPAHNIIKDFRFGYIKKKLIIPVDLKNIPNYKNIITSLQNADYITDDHGQVYGVPMAHGPYGLAYNTKFFDSPPTSWNVFWNPKFKSKYTISSDYYETNLFIVALSAGLRGDDLYRYEKLREKEISSKLKVLAHNAHSFWKGVDTADDLYGMALATTWGFSFGDLKKRGEIWKMADPIEGTTGWVDNFIMSAELRKYPFLKKVAEEWMNFILSPDFQVEVVVRQLFSDPVNITIKDRLTDEEVKHHHLNDLSYFHKKRWLWPIFKTKRERNGLKFLWDEATGTIKH